MQTPPKGQGYGGQEKTGYFDFKGMLPRLVSTYESGRLVPFIGAGMSKPLCADWPGLICGLENAAGIAPSIAKRHRPKPEDLVQRADAATQRLRRGAPDRFHDELSRALFKGGEVPEQTKELASIAWPLVLTTNYDNAYVCAHEANFGVGGLAVVGRSAEDCQRVLTSLNTAGRTLLWTLQGHLGEPFQVSTRNQDKRLSAEAVIDYSEYRRVTHRAPHFRRAFAEVFRHRSLLFLGSRLRESYLQELFGEVIEIYGPSTRTHFAIMPEGEVDPRFMYERFQIAVIGYGKGKHSQLLKMLRDLKYALDKTTGVPVGWAWGALEHDSRRDVRESKPELEFLRSPLPRKKGKRECLVVSAGSSRKKEEFVLSSEAKSSIRETVAKWGVGEGDQPAKVYDARFVGEYYGKDGRTTNVFAVKARPDNDDQKDLSEIGRAACALFDVVARRYDCIRMQLLAAGGGTDPTTSRRWSVRAFPTRFSFIEVVRAWGKWRRGHPRNRCRLALHVVDTALAREIASGRIDVLEIFRSNDIRFWAEVVEAPDKLARRLFQVQPEETKLGDVCDELGLTPEEWTLEISPPATIDMKDELEQSLAKDRLERTLDRLTVVPGSTLHFRRRKTTGIFGVT
jgi:SIR2-like domain